MSAGATLVTQLSSEPIPDEVLVGQVLAGELGSFTSIMRRYNQRLYRVARAILRDGSEAEDVVQHAYLSAYAHLSQFSGQSAFSTWLTRIVVHEACARIRRLQRSRVLSASQDAPAWVSGRGAKASPEDQASHAELVRLLEEAIDALPETCRAILVLREIEGLSTLESAQCLAITEEAARVRLHRARALLREALWERAGLAVSEVFEIGGARCSGIAERVLAELGQLDLNAELQRQRDESAIDREVVIALDAAANR